VLTVILVFCTKWLSQIKQNWLVQDSPDGPETKTNLVMTKAIYKLSEIILLAKERTPSTINRFLYLNSDDFCNKKY